MRDRHLPRLCGHCRAPMARQEDTCWHCGTRWASEAGPRTAMRVIAGGASEQARLDVFDPEPAALARG
jgi:hypothetical protein